MLSHDQIMQDLQALKEIGSRLKAPESPFAVSTLSINGIDTPIFSKAPNNLFEIYKLCLEQPDLPFLIYQDERYSFGESFCLATKMAGILQHDFGIEKGDRVAICSRNNPQWCIAYMAITMLGAVVVPMNSWWQSNELQFGLQDSGSKLLFADPERITRLHSETDRRQVQIIAIDPKQETDYPNFQALLNKQSDAVDFDPAAQSVSPEDNASIMYTSGSTGQPKGVLSTHRAIISALYSWHFAKEMGEELRPELKAPEDAPQPGVLANVPLFHVTGNHAQFLLSFLYKRKFVMMYKWNAEQALALIEKEQLSVLHGVPTMTWEVMNSPDFAKTDLSTLRSVQSGGAARPPEHLAMMQQRFPEQAQPGLGYGLTETNAIGATITGKFYYAKPESTGRPTPPVTSIRIEDEQGKVLASGQIGEICIKGPTVMKGYWQRPQDTAEAIKDGWFHTGDLGLLDAHGFLIIKDRAKDIVIRGGENIACAEVEYALAEHPKVCEAAVFGIPDARLGERVAAAIMVMPSTSVTQDELNEFLSTRIAGFKIPSFYRIQQEQLARIASGKIAKKLIRESVIESLPSLSQ